MKKSVGISYPETQAFSKLVIDYLADAPALRPFYGHRPDVKGIEAAIAAKASHDVNRGLLVEVPKKQYANETLTKQQQQHLEKPHHALSVTGRMHRLKRFSSSHGAHQQEMSPVTRLRLHQTVEHGRKFQRFLRLSSHSNSQRQLIQSTHHSVYQLSIQMVQLELRHRSVLQGSTNK